MPVRVLIPTALKQYADNTETIEFDGQTVNEIIDKLTSHYPNLKAHLLDDNGSLRNFVNVFVNEDNIRDQQNMDTAVADGDEVVIVPAIAGGTFDFH